MTGPITNTRGLVAAIGQMFPEFNLKGRMLFLGRIEYLIRGISLEPSAFDKTSFYPTVFVQPLYMPVDYFFFTFGGRLQQPPSHFWNIAREEPASVLAILAECLREKAIPFLTRFQKPIDLALACEVSGMDDFSWIKDDINVLESAAYSWILGGNSRKAVANLQKIELILKEDPDDRVWVLDLRRRAANFVEMLTAGKEDAARRQLDIWADKAADVLGLGKFRDRPVID